MISKKQIDEIRGFLDKSENPVFIWDGDTDGLCSFMLLRSYAGKGHHIIARDGPEVREKYLRDVNKISPDLIVILDKPYVSQEFVDGCNVPVIWIDHHQPVKVNGVRYYNPRLENLQHDNCTTYWAYEVAQRDLWIAMMGIVADWRIDHIAEFAKQYPGLIKHKVKIAPDVLYNTELGTLIKYSIFILKGPTSDVRKNVELMIGIKTPYELLNGETEKARELLDYAKKVEKEYDKLLKSALENKTDDKFYFFSYPKGKYHLPGELSNELVYRMPDKFIMVARQEEEKVAFSLRGTNYYIPAILEEALKGLDGRGGGHDHACGGIVNPKDFSKLLESLKKLVNRT